MNQNLQNTIKDELARLPKDTQAAINSVNWLQILEELGKRNLLNAEQIEKLQIETLLIFSGLVNEETYRQNLQKHVGITDEKSIVIKAEVVEKIIMPMENYGEKEALKNKKDNNSELEKNVNFILSGGEFGE